VIAALSQAYQLCPVIQASEERAPEFAHLQNQLLLQVKPDLHQNPRALQLKAHNLRSLQALHQWHCLAPLTRCHCRAL